MAAPKRILVTARTIHAGDPPRPGPTAMAVEGGRIGWLGPAAETPGPVPRTKVDLGDGVVIPGLVDSHAHMGILRWLPGWADCRAALGPEEVVARLKAHAPSVPDGAWIVGWGYQAAAGGGRRPTRRMLDEVSPTRPVVVIESSYHQGAANSPALAAVGFGRRTPGRWGGELERDRRGEPTGMA